MRLIPAVIVLTLASSWLGIAQKWELGGLGGYGWTQSSSVSNATIPGSNSAEIGFPSRATVGVVFAENPYRYWGGEIRWLFQWGGPQIERNGIKTSTTGYSNLVTYDFVVYPVRREAGIRPYLAGGAGVKAYTGTGFGFVGQTPTAALAVLRSITEAEPVISVGGGVKCMLAKQMQFRLDFRAYFTPTPNEVIRPIGGAVIHGWLSNLVPTAGISYVF